jgi:DNA-binding GntR family transcriptional regulator
MELETYIEQSFTGRQTIADSVASALRRAILGGALEGGLALRQEDLAKKFGVSRVPIREALLKLEAEGLVKATPRRGVIVSALNADDFAEILEMRYALEPLALGIAIPQMTADDLETARRILKESTGKMTSMQMEDGRSEFEARWGELNWAFHRALYFPARRPRLLHTIENLHLLFSRHLRMRVAFVLTPVDRKNQTASKDVARGKSEWARVHSEHQEILNACEQKKTATAIRILKNHINSNGQELVERLKIKSRSL